MTVLKVSQWITVDFEKPETIPKPSNKNLIYMREFKGKFYCDYVTFDEDGLYWEDSGEEVVCGDRYAPVNLEGLNWNIHDLDNPKIFPSEGPLYLLSDNGHYRLCRLVYQGDLTDSGCDSGYIWKYEDDIFGDSIAADSWLHYLGAKYIEIIIEG